MGGIVMVNVSYSSVNEMLDHWKFKKSMRNRIKKSFNLERLFKTHEKYRDLESTVYNKIKKREEKEKKSKK
jgi:hypothetical protein